MHLSDRGLAYRGFVAMRRGSLYNLTVCSAWLKALQTVAGAVRGKAKGKQRKRGRFIASARANTHSPTTASFTGSLERGFSSSPETSPTKTHRIYENLYSCGLSGYLGLPPARL